MTNAMIIFQESIRLMDEGVLNGSGEFAEIEAPDGTKKTVELPEQIHTFNGWKERGYCVKKGEKSKIKFPIWKHTAKRVENEKWRRRRTHLDVYEGIGILYDGASGGYLT